MVNAEDPLAIATAIGRTLTEPKLRERLGARGLARAADFTWERTAKSTLDVYRAVNEEAAPRRGW